MVAGPRGQVRAQAAVVGVAAGVVAERHGRAAVHHTPDPVFDRRGHHVVGTQHVHPERLRRVVTDHRAVHDRVHVLCRAGDLRWVGDVEGPLLVRRFGADRPRPVLLTDALGQRSDVAEAEV